MMSRRLANEVRKAGVVSTVSERALIRRAAPLRSSAYHGTRPQRNGSMSRSPWCSTTPATSSVGATLNRCPGRSTVGRARKMRASSSLECGWANRPHIGQSRSRR